MGKRDRTTCKCCRRYLRDSQYLLAGRAKAKVGIYKSCSYCSKEAGYHVYHRIVDFGMWHVHDDAENPYLQSECVAAFRARGGDADPHWTENSVRCGETSEVPRDGVDGEVQASLDVARERAAADLIAPHEPGRSGVKRSPKQRRVA